MRVVIAEKPSVARDIAKVLKATEKKEGYFEGNGWQVTWAYGHLVGLCEPETYGWGTPWSKDVLPMIPSEFKLQLLEDSQARSKKENMYLQQYKVLQGLFKSADFIVCATDAGREGELIFRNIYNYMGCKTPVKRLWISSLTESAIKQGFENLKEGSDYDNIYHSAECRAKADWIIGMNATRSLTLANPNKGLFTLGRVQTPTFSFVCKRYYENKNFVQTFYYKLRAKLSTSDKTQFFSVCPESFESKEAAEKRIESLGKVFTVVKVENKKLTERAPLPFSLTDLQRTANRLLGMSAQDTLTALQSLYEAKMTTYPRTDSSYLAEDMIQPISDNVGSLNRLNLNKELKNGLAFISKNGIQKSCFDNSKLTDHHAVIPTFEGYEKYVNLNINEQKIYDLVVKRFIQSLLPPCKKDQVIYTLEAKDKTLFKSVGTSIKDAGWRITLSQQETKEEKDDEESQTLPPVIEGENVDVLQVVAEERKTQRPPLLTEAELLKLMETAGKMIEDQELSKAIKDCGLGTPATRASVIESLKIRKLVEIQEKKYLVPTTRGLAIYDGVKNLDLSKPDVTGEWECKLNKIAEGSFNAEAFIEEIKDKAVSLIKELDKVIINVEMENKGNPKLLTEDLTCPLCGGKIIEGERTVRCENYQKDNPSSCQFLLFKSNKYHTFSSKEIKELTTNMETSDIVLLTNNETKKSYNVRFKFDKETNKVGLIFDNNLGIICPKCGKPMVEYKSSYACSGNTKENPTCNFLVWKNMSGHEMTKAELDILLKEKILKSVSFLSKEGKPYKANLVLNEDFTTTVVFEDRNEEVGICPKCGAPVIDFGKGCKCTRNTKENPTCDFIMWKNVSGHELTQKEIQALMKGDTLKKVQLISSRSGKKYEADLVYSTESNRVEIKLK